MLTLNGLSQFDFFANFKLFAGSRGMDNPISNVVILEYESSLQDYSGFTAGNLVLSSLFFAKDDETLIYEAFEELIKRGISGIAVKNAYYHSFPANVIDLANKHGIPLFLFHDVYMEDIIISVNRLNEETERFKFYEDQLISLIMMSDHKVLCKHVIEQINPAFTSYLTALFYTPSEQSFHNHAQYNQLVYLKNILPDSGNIFLSRFFTGYLILFHFEKLVSTDEAKEYMLHTLELLHLDSNQGSYSYCPICHIPQKADELLLKCCYADITRLFTKANIMSYESIGIHKMLLPSLIRPETSRYFREQLALLEEYDASKKGALLPTLIAYVQSDMQINAAADILFQHPNTVRYRLDKIKELLSVDNSFSFSILATYLVELYYIKQLDLPHPIADIFSKYA